NFAPGSTLWTIHKRSAPTSANSFASVDRALRQRTNKGWPHDDDDRDFSEWNNARERQCQPQTAPQYAERRGPDLARERGESAAQLLRPPGRCNRHGRVQPGALGSRSAPARKRDELRQRQPDEGQRDARTQPRHPAQEAQAVRPVVSRTLTRKGGSHSMRSPFLLTPPRYGI